VEKCVRGTTFEQTHLPRVELVPEGMLVGRVDPLARLEPVGADMLGLLERRDEGVGADLGDARVVDDGPPCGLRLRSRSSWAAKP
jgi:hypothetical protein